MKNLILIVTNKNDEHADRIVSVLDELGEHTCRFNTEAFPLRIAATLSCSGASLKIPTRVAENSGLVDLNEVKSVWYRRPTPPLIPDRKTEEGYARFIKNESETALWSLYTTLDAFWINQPLSHRLLERNKLLQLKKAALVGLTVPDTIITNDPDVLLGFADAHGGVVAIKLLKGDWFRERNSEIPLLVFTQRVASDQIREHYEDIKLTPILAQQYIEKALELRVTIVGEKTFACAIHSQDSEHTRTDWRDYDLEHVKHEPFELPDEVRVKLGAFMEKCNLSYGAIDIIVTPEDEYVFLEVNPSGQWLWIEELTGMPISKTLAELLAYPPR